MGSYNRYIGPLKFIRFLFFQTLYISSVCLYAFLTKCTHNTMLGAAKTLKALQMVSMATLEDN